MKTPFKLKSLVAATSVAVFALLAAPVASHYLSSGTLDLVAQAQAAEDSAKGKGAASGQKGSGVKGGSDAGHAGSGGSKSLESTVLTETEEEGGKGKMGNTDTGPAGKGKHDTNKQKGSGKGGPSADSDAKGPHAGGSAGSSGGKPVWAQEGIDESVEMGRLNVARAPAKVIDKATTTALASIAINPSLYQLPTLQAVSAAILAGTYVRIDSPLENLGLYKTVLKGSSLGITTTLSAADLSAIFLAGAADKTVPITAVTVTNINTMLGVALPAGTTAESVAVAADALRAAILTAHGE
jgi:hypothetical protein